MKLSLESVLSRLDHGWKKMHWDVGLDECHNRLFMR
jgi:hypothetical protein